MDRDRRAVPVYPPGLFSDERKSERINGDRIDANGLHAAMFFSRDFRAFYSRFSRVLFAFFSSSVPRLIGIKMSYSRTSANGHLP